MRSFGIRRPHLLYNLISDFEGTRTDLQVCSCSCSRSCFSSCSLEEELATWRDSEVVVVILYNLIRIHQTDELFQCGQFCAVFINPCIFHTGLFVLEPSSKVFKDMLRDLDNRRDNPDGADQGFIGGYFPDLLDQPMFIHPLMEP
ncbi:putative glycogenin glucosyltransferase [Helianthus annuus]|nr:putative glycogenin glucosyltransferase [Helianthus annuus]